MTPPVRKRPFEVSERHRVSAAFFARSPAHSGGPSTCLWQSRRGTELVRVEIELALGLFLKSLSDQVGLCLDDVRALIAAARLCSRPTLHEGPVPAHPAGGANLEAPRCFPREALASMASTTHSRKSADRSDALGSPPGIPSIESPSVSAKIPVVLTVRSNLSADQV